MTSMLVLKVLRVIPCYWNVEIIIIVILIMIILVVIIIMTLIIKIMI